MQHQGHQTSQSTIMSTTMGAETAALTLARFSLFFACRKYLLRSLYLDLRTLTSSALPSTPTSEYPNSHGNIVFDANANGSSAADNEGIELDTLPLPTTHTPKSAKFSLEDTTYLHTSVSRVVFSWCFAESCMMFILLILQALGIFSPSSRLLNWRISLFILMSAILVVIPLSVSILLSIGTTDRTSFRNVIGFRAILSLIPVGIYLFALSNIPLPASLEASDTATSALSRLIVVGTVILGLLSGFGAISSSWKYLSFGAQSVPSERDIDTAQYALTSVRNDMKERRAEAARREGSSETQRSWFSRAGSSFRGADSLTQELRGLEALEYQMSRNLEALRERYEAAKFTSTFKGRVFNFVGRIFMIYCIFRVISSIYNVLFRGTRRTSSTTTYTDLITDLLAYLLSKLYSDESESRIRTEDIASFSRQLSLVLVGIIILSSIRLVLRGVTRALRITSRNLAASLMLLVLAQIMGIYMLSTLVQMRSSFPPPTIDVDENLFSTIPAYEVFGSLFDWSFLLAAGASVFVRWGAERVNGTGNMD
ncbi:Abscisic acid G-protein coupled receptor-domain-containing protein [Gymnopilus junonius]|uniref:Abscisic acid G-protein coupled receptor-domain-containing protein n=1 Tax=Gymnopilus junonius TaxID=109634 RepID=A0A9P5TMU3_GYMJU|nr:Abscisic acid G-protein coupled receptor-domain-containing protein [Gymnopilus junonius]